MARCPRLTEGGTHRGSGAVVVARRREAEKGVREQRKEGGQI